MKKNLAVIIIQFFLLSGISAQNTGIGISAPRGKLHIKGNADTSQLVIDANTTQSNTSPLIRLRNAAGTDLLHIHSDNINNTFLDLNAGRFNNPAGGALANTFLGASAGASNLSGYSLTALGSGALFSNTSGGENTAIGSISLYYNTTGFNNTAIGRGALYQNNSSDNTATGFKSLFSNVGGYENTALGSLALVTNINGSKNTAVGLQSLFSNTESQNTAIGYRALYSNVSGINNVVVGYQANANSNTSGNTIIGSDAFVSGSNSVALGYLAYVKGNNSSAIGISAFVFEQDNKIRLGSSSTNIIEGQVNFSSPSDGRFKTNITETVKGLEFITKLRPVVYNFQTKKYDDFLRKDMPQNVKFISNQDFSATEKIRQSGFIAQEVEQAAKEAGYDFNGIIIPKNECQTYSLTYAQFVVPLVKAVQEQQFIIQELEKKLEFVKAEMPVLLMAQQTIIEELKKQMAEIKTELNLFKSNVNTTNAK